MRYEELGDALGERTGVRSEVIPQSYYPVQLSVEKLEASSNAGTPGLFLSAVVTEGPFAGSEVEGWDAVIWLSPGKVGEDARNPGGNIGKVNHMVHAVTGLKPAFDTAAEYGFAFTDVTDGARTRREFAEQFWALDDAQRVAFMRAYARTDEWNGKTVIALIEIEDEKRVNETTGEEYSTSRNRIGSFFNVNDEKKGIAYVRKVHFPQQEKAQEIMHGA